MDDDSAQSPEQLRQQLAMLRQQQRVEQATERIREHVLTMRKSEDMAIVAGVMYEEMNQLGIDTPIAAINLIDEEGGWIHYYNAIVNPKTFDASWHPPSQHPYRLVEINANTIVWSMSTPITRQPNDVPQEREMIQRWRHRQLHTFEVDWSREEIYQDWAQPLGVEKTIALDAYIENYWGKWTVANIPFRYGMIAIWQRSFEEKKRGMVEKLVEGLALGYLRFLDIERLEAQVRQAQVEAALERVRAEVGSMEESQDLFEILPLVEASVKELGVACDQFSFNIIDESAHRMRVYWSSGLLSEHALDQEGDVADNYRHWKEGEVHHRQLEGRWVVDVPFTQGMLAMNRRGDDGFSPADIDLLQRFAAALSLGYIRVLEFQRMEEQALQARRERAVERVRAEATSMQQSRDVVKVMIALWQGLAEMIPPLEGFTLNIQDQDADLLRVYAAIKLSGAVTMANFPPDKLIQENIVGDVHLLGTEIPLAFAYEHGWATREVKAYVLRMPDNFYLALEQSWGAQLPPGAYAGHAGLNVPFDYGGIFVMGTQSADYGPEELAIAESFATAVSLGYTRFLDLQQLETQNRALERTLQEKEQAQEALVRSESMAAIGTLVAGAAHELNNPIAAAASLVQTVQEMVEEDSAEELEADRAAIVDNLAFSRKELNRAKDIVGALLDLSRQSQDYTEAVDLQTVAQDALRGLHGRYSSDQVTIAEDYQADIPKVQGNFAQLVQVALNLITNAVDALVEHKGQITLRTYKQGDQVVLECRDTGSGMPDEIRQDIFKPFFTTKAPGKGTGLGLYVCHQIVTKHNGSIEVDTQAGKGTTCKVSLPTTSI